MRRSIPLLALISLLVGGDSRAAERQANEKQANRVLEAVVLDDSKPDIGSPFRDSDSIVLVGESGLTNILMGFNISHDKISEEAGDVAMPRNIVMAGDGFYVCQPATKQLLRYNFNGKRTLSFMGFSINSIDTTPDGRAYCISRQMMFGHFIYVFNPLDFQELVLQHDNEKGGGGYDLVVDWKNRSLWVVGTNITRYSLNPEGPQLKKEFVVKPAYNEHKFWAALSVDYCSDGSVWAAERKKNDVEGSRNRLLRVSLEGKLVDEIDIEYIPICVAVDRKDDSVWVAGTDGVLRYDNTGKAYLKLEGISLAYSVKLNPYDGSVWFAGKDVVGWYSPEDGSTTTLPIDSSSYPKQIAVPSIVSK